MSLDTNAIIKTYTAQTNLAENRKKKVFYNFCQLKGHTLKNGKYVSPTQMLRVLKTYESYTKSGEFDRIRDMEESNSYPKTWANFIMHDLLGKRHYLKTQRSI